MEEVKEQVTLQAMASIVEEASPFEIALARAYTAGLRAGVTLEVSKKMEAVEDKLKPNAESA